ncbi:MAG: hypothetical protein O7G31_06230 [Calditrichaeota bacterium]|nr:hypothetical protein [Calditrichota bacterium]
MYESLAEFPARARLRLIRDGDPPVRPVITMTYHAADWGSDESFGISGNSFGE